MSKFEFSRFLRSDSVWGLLRALETFSQMVHMGDMAGKTGVRVFILN